jgi:hypothetical protein
MVHRTITALSLPGAIADELRSDFDSGALRFEQFMELVSSVFDPDLTLLEQPGYLSVAE